MKLIKLSCGMLFATLLISSCQKDQTQSAGEVSQPVPATPAADPNAINQPIADGAFTFQLGVASAPRITPEGKLEFSVDVNNTGTVPVYGAGAMPVNLGVQVLGVDGSPESAGGLRDFIRVPLPMTQPGVKHVVRVEVPADVRLDGMELRIALVQEGVRWYDSEQNQTLNIGKFSICGSSFCALPAN